MIETGDTSTMAFKEKKKQTKSKIKKPTLISHFHKLHPFKSQSLEMTDVIENYLSTVSRKYIIHNKC
ncbi:hypothetical protein AL525_000005 [Citrobacter amalonaticus]|nr:hypothetical protein AL525_000005 [Citrobacter amalonaticus]